MEEDFFIEGHQNDAFDGEQFDIVLHALKLQELVKERMNATYVSGHKLLSDENGYLEQELRSLVEESQK